MAISLSSGVRQSLQSLQSTASQAQAGQLRLATGKRVNSAVDNPTNFFTAQGLNNRADQFSGLLDGISNSVQTIKNASTGIEAVTKQVKALQGTIKQAQAEAAINRPTATGSALATAAEATAATKDLKSVALDKFVFDQTGGTATTADAATATSAGDRGIAKDTVNVLTVSAGDKTFTSELGATTTIRDVVNKINESGIATAAVGTDGTLTVTGTGSDALKIGIGGSTTAALALTDAQSGTDNAAIGLTAAAYTTGLTSSGSSSVRANLVQQYNDARTQLDQLAKDSGFNGTNLLAGDKLKVTFNEKTGAAQSKLDVQGENVTSANLGITTATNTGFQNDTSLATAADALTNALSTLQSVSSSLGSSLSTVQTRQDFSKALIDNLRTGADNLTNADPNEEGASLLALQTRQQLSQTALSLSSQADQAVLRLF